MFSNREEEIIKIIGKKKVTIKIIAGELFENKILPFDWEISVGNSVRRIIEKCEHYKLPWTLTKIKEGRHDLISKIKRDIENANAST
jgi:hypothetical protein